MKTMKFFRFMLAWLITLPLVTSCKDDVTPPEDPPQEEERNCSYAMFISADAGTETLVIDSISASLTKVSNLPDWCTIRQTGTEDGHPVLSISHQAAEPNQLRPATVAQLDFSDGTVFLLQLQQYINAECDVNSADDEKFLTDWEHQEQVRIFSNKGSIGGTQVVNTPWAGVSNHNMPTEVAEDVKKEDGWIMAFSFLNQEGLPNTNYFGLYNKYLGILRVFYYVQEAKGSGSNYCFEVKMGAQKKDVNHLPFYNGLQYAIPLSHPEPASTNPNASIGIIPTSTFSSYCVPHIQFDSPEMKTGWTAFDIDMSAYVPTQQREDYYKNTNEDAFSIACYSWEKAAISLTGDLTANINGEYDAPSVTSTAGTIGTVINALEKGNSMLSAYNKVADKVSKISDKKKDKEKAAASDRSVTAVLAAVEAGINLGTMVLKKFDDTKKEYHRGKIDMNLTGKISLSGNMTKTSANDVPPLNFKKRYLKTDSKDCIIGKGVWSLADDPVVYIVGDHSLGVARRGINLAVKGDHTYGVGGDTETLQLRMVSFLDPTSIRLNLNTEELGNVTDVDVETYYGVYPFAGEGHSAGFRKIVGIQAPSALSIVDHTKFGNGTTASSANDEFKMKLHLIEQADFETSYYFEEKNTSELVECTKGDRVERFYGYLDQTTPNKGFIPYPQVYFPTSADGLNIYDDYIPDFVVCINVNLKVGDRTFIYSRRFLPRIEVISGSQLEQKYNELVEYAAQSEAGRPISYVENAPSIPVTQMLGYELVQKDLKVLKTILNK